MKVLSSVTVLLCAIIAVGHAQKPTISGFSPQSGPINTPVTITGTNFSLTPGNNIVFFGATRGTVTAANATQLTVSVPAGATYQPISVTVGGLTAYSRIPFSITFGGNGVASTSMSNRVNFTTGTSPQFVALSDLNADGKVDMALVNFSSNTISIYKNTATPGSLTSGSFNPRTDYPTTDYAYCIVITDLDGDGKPDLVVGHEGGASCLLSILRNTSNGSTISFDSEVSFMVGNNSRLAAIGDLNEDGRPEIVVTNLNGGSVSILRNTTTSGSFNSGSFATAVEIVTGTQARGVAIGDLDGDNKPDIAVTNGATNILSVFRNSGLGIISTGMFDPKADFPTFTFPYSVAIGDMDGDGKPDLAVASYNNNSPSVASVYRNTSSPGSLTAASFAAKQEFAAGDGGVAVSMDDIDGDGKTDLAIANWGSTTISVLRNVSTSGIINFATKVDFTAGMRPANIAIGDLDGDGRPDFAAPNAIDATLSIYRNSILVNQTISFDALSDVTYGDTPFSLLATASSGLGVTYTSSDPTVASVSGNTVTILKAGSTIITAQQSGNAVYNPASDVPQTLTVKKAPLVATAVNKNKVYGTANPAFTLSYSGFVGTDNAAVIDSPPTSSTLATQFSDVGTYAITLAGGTDNNYIISLVNGTLTITKAPLTITADNKNKVYGTLNPALTFTYTGFLGTDNAASIDSPPAISCAATQFSNAGAYPIILAGGTDNNYSFTLVNGTLTITKATLTATADPQNKIYGTVNPALTFTYAGFLGTDNAAGIDTPPTIATAATQFSNVGSYPITLTGGTDNNYSFTLVNGSLTIAKAALSATAVNKNKVYGTANPVFTLSYSGFVGTDNAVVIDSPPTSSTLATQFSDVGTYAITLAGGTDNNYIISLVNGTLTITKAPLTITADNKNKVYGTLNPALTFTYTGFLGTDNAASIDSPPAISCAATQFSNAGAYPIILAGGTDNNYSFTLVNGTLTITKATLTATADPQNKIYGTVNPALTFTYAGFLGTDNAAGIDTPPTIATAATQFSNVGSYPITLTGGTDNNYSFTLVNGSLTIAKAALSATAVNKNKVYGTANPVFTLSYSGFVGTDNAVVIDSPPTSSTLATQFSDVGTYAITLAGGTDNNYIISLVNGTLTITKAPLTITADNKNKVYGTLNPALTFTYTGFLGTDNAASIDSPPAISCAATQFSNAGAYPIILAGGTDNNYSFTLVNGTLTITKATLTATADPQNKIYGTVNPALTFTYAGFLGTDNAAGIDTPPTIATAATQFSNVGSYPITLTGGTDNNYSFTLVNGSLTIAKAALSATAVNKNKVYGTANPVFTLSYSGFVGTDNAVVIDSPPTSSTLATQFSDVGTYAITLAGGTDNNYIISLVNGTLTITKANQTITFDPLADHETTGAPFSLTGSSSSGLTVAYASSDVSVVTVAGNVVTIVGFGTTNITASQTGNNNYNAATPVVQSLRIKSNQTISFGALPNKTFGDGAFILNAIATSGLPVTFSSSDPLVVSISGNTVTIVGAGSAIITATQIGDVNFIGASTTRVQNVLPAVQSIAFTSVPDKQLSDPPFALSATASSGLAVTFGSATDKLSINGAEVTLLKPGRVTVQAAQSGSTNFEAAVSVDRSFCISPLKPVITSNADPVSPMLTSSATEGNQWYLNSVVISGATGQTHLVTASGTYTVLTKIDDCSSEVSNPFSIVVTGDIVVGKGSIALYPNPASVNIAIRGLVNVVGAQLIEMNGGVSVFQMERSDDYYTGNIEYLPQGVHTLRIQADGQVYFLRFVRQ